MLCCRRMANALTNRLVPNQRNMSWAVLDLHHRSFQQCQQIALTFRMSRRLVWTQTRQSWSNQASQCQAMQRIRRTRRAHRNFEAPKIDFKIIKCIEYLNIISTNSPKHQHQETRTSHTESSSNNVVWWMWCQALDVWAQPSWLRLLSRVHWQSAQHQRLRRDDCSLIL